MTSGRTRQMLWGWGLAAVAVSALAAVPEPESAWLVVYRPGPRGSRTDDSPSSP